MERNESIVTKGFLFKYNLILSPFPRWFIIFTLGFCGLIKAALWNCEFVSILSSESKFGQFVAIRYTIYNVVILSRCVISTFFLDWKSFAACTKELSRVELEKDEESVQRINKDRRVKNWFCFISIFAYKMTNIFYFVNQPEIGLFSISIFLVNSILYYGHFFLIHSLVDLCVCLQAAFRYINHHLAHFQVTSPNLMLSELRRNRSLYSCTIRASREAEKFARHYVAWFYFQFFLMNILNTVDILGLKKETSLAFVLFMALDIINTGYLTLNLVAVNKVSTEGMEDLYEISYDLKSYILQNENNLFLNRMLWQNVGFTFSNLFLINPKFITSLLSFSLTIALMIASFLYH